MLSPPKHSPRNLLVPKKQGLDLCLDSSQAESVIPENSRDSNLDHVWSFHNISMFFFGSRIPQTVRSNTHRVFHLNGHPGHQWHIRLKPVGEPSDGHDPKIATWCCRFPRACRKKCPKVQLNVTGDQTDTLWWTYKKQLKIAIEIVDFPINSMVIFHCFLFVHQRVKKSIHMISTNLDWADLSEPA